MQSRVAHELRAEEDIVSARAAVKRVVALLGMSPVNQTKVVTAASELARNTVEHGCGGNMVMEVIEEGIKQGIRLTFEDRGPGIPNIDQAMRDGFTSAGGMGLGLGGSKRLMDEFTIDSTHGQGTQVVVIKWT
ncbi:MAG: anti-sigma regulatory factor [Candidatus Obscuribacterales bacterium]